MNCTRCDGTGWLNYEQIPDEDSVDCQNIEDVEAWISAQTEPHDVAVCDCCGDGDNWHGTPGEHYGHDDPPGPDGPYASNGGHCHCH